MRAVLSNPFKAVEECYLAMERLFSKRGILRPSSVALEEYARTLKINAAFVAPQISCIVSAFDSALYSSVACSTDSARDAFNAYNEIVRALKKR